MQLKQKINLLLLCCLYCVPAVIYCRTVIKLEDLTFEKISKLVNFEIQLNEWNASLNQYVPYPIQTDVIMSVDVKREVTNYLKTYDKYKIDTELTKVHSIILSAYHCTVQRYATLVSYLQLQDLRKLKTDLIEAKAKAAVGAPDALLGDTSVYNSEYVNSQFSTLGIKYPLDFEFRGPGGELIVRTKGDFQRTSEKKIKAIWETLVRKEPKFEIQYDVYTDVIKVHNPDYRLGSVESDLTEVMCVFNEIIRLVDNWVVDKCSQHEGSYVKGFASLKADVNEAFEQYLLELDAMRDSETDHRFYTDYSKIADEVNKSAKVQASGCFVKTMIFKINHLEKNFETTESATEIYGKKQRRVSKKLVVNSKVGETTTPQNDSKASSSKNSDTKDFRRQDDVKTSKDIMEYIMSIDQMSMVKYNKAKVEEEKSVNMELALSDPQSAKEEKVKSSNIVDFLTSELVVVPTNNNDSPSTALPDPNAANDPFLTSTPGASANVPVDPFLISTPGDSANVPVDPFLISTPGANANASVNPFLTDDPNAGAIVPVDTVTTSTTSASIPPSSDPNDLLSF